MDNWNDTPDYRDGLTQDEKDANKQREKEIEIMIDKQIKRQTQRFSQLIEWSYMRIDRPKIRHDYVIGEMALLRLKRIWNQL